MPLVRITLRQGKPADFLAAASAAIHQALVTNANVPADDLFHVIDEVASSNLIAHPTYAGMERSDDVIFIEITLNAGRTIEIKRALYADIASRFGAIGVRPDDILVNLVEVTKENWSFGRGLATYAS
ncbi:MAG TPA: tautomerase family protein [Thermoanaerobaculia bacterium]|jgi:phenylpyruvate tautomerase PptA (4-oxalocrotonate tautomerase family)